MSTGLIAAAVQMASGPNLNANLLETRRHIATAVNEGARLVVLPENFAFMGRKHTDILGVAETEGVGPIQKFLAQSARDFSIWLVGGTTPLASGQRVRAACLVYNSQGQLAGRYDKMHLFDVNLIEEDEVYCESESIEPGNIPCVINTPFGRLGLAICYDLRFPELFRNLTDQHAEMIALPAAFTATTGMAHWEVLVRARAIENLAFVIASAQEGSHISGRKTYGHSMIVGPWGDKLGELGKGTGIVCARLDFDQLHSVRENFPSLRHRRLHCTID